MPNLVVPDVGTTADFYERIFGAVKIEETQVNNTPLIRLELHGSEIWLSGAMMPGLQTHCGLIAEDFDAAPDELKLRQVTFLGEPLQIGARRLAMVTDNNGQQIGIVTPA